MYLHTQKKLEKKTPSFLVMMYKGYTELGKRQRYCLMDPDPLKISFYINPVS